MNLANVKLVCLMPTYNKQDTLSKAIESVIMQKADFAYKLVILDDYSSDDSHTIAQQYQAKFPDKIEIVRNATNMGLLKSITNGYSLLKGVDYFCVLDADDWYIYDKKFADAVEFLEANRDFVSYFANVVVVENGKETLYYGGDVQVLDYDWSDYKRGKWIATQTSGGIFRNVYFKDGINEAFLQGTKKPYCEAIRADGFRVVWHINAGKAHFVNNKESVYNCDIATNGGGNLWASLQPCEQDLLNAQLYFALADFFPNESNFFLKHTKSLYDKAIESFRNADKNLIVKNKDLVFYIYSQTYLTNNPLFDNPTLTIEKQNSFIENIFSIKNSPDKRHKNITILGLKIKIRKGSKDKSPKCK